MKKKTLNIRKNELKLTKRVGLTEEAHSILRVQRKIQEKSMARIVNDLIIKLDKK
jgi:hypothetical protein